MRSLLLILTILPSCLFGQDNFGYLKVKASFNEYKGLNERINGSVKINNQTYHFGNGELLITQNIGAYQISTTCWMNTLNLKQHYRQSTNVQVTSNDTTLVEISIPDSLLISVDYLPLLDRTGKFFPLPDSLAFLDEEGKRYGIWTGPRSYIGDCLNYFGTSYVLYNGDNVLLQVEAICDMNFCYKSEKPYSVTFTRYFGKSRWQLTIFPEKSICESIDDDIYFRLGQAIESDGQELRDIIMFFRENLRKKPGEAFVFRDEKLNGDYLLFVNEVLSDTLQYSND